MSLEDLVRELYNIHFYIQQEDFRFQQDNLRFATKTRVEMQRLSDQLAQIADSVRRLKESQLELHHLETIEEPNHEVIYFDDEEDDEDPEPWTQ